MREAGVQCRLPERRCLVTVRESMVGDRPPYRPLSVRHVSDHYTTSFLALETDVACLSAMYTFIILAHAFLIGPSEEKPECDLHEEGDATQGTRQTLDENGPSSRNERSSRRHSPIAQSTHTVPSLPLFKNRTRTRYDRRDAYGVESDGTWAGTESHSNLPLTAMQPIEMVTRHAVLEHEIEEYTG
jgi:hypothetical protein